MNDDSTRATPLGWHHRYAVLVACATFVLVIAGGLVTSTGSGLAVPDWPLSFGQVFPRLEGGVLFEHGHRLIASTVGLLTVVLAAWTARVEPRGWVRALGWSLLGAVILQGVLGGLTVLLRLPDAVSVAHAGLAQIFFALTVVMATVTSPGFGAARPAAPSDAADGTRRLAFVMVIAVYAQILLGAVVRHTGAGLAIPDFPLSFGRLVPEFTSSLVAWQFAHRVGAVVVTVLVFALAARVLTRHGSQTSLVRAAALLLVIVSGQFFLGALAIWTRRAVTPTTAHVANGALLFAASVVTAVRCQQILAVAERVPVAAPSADPVSEPAA